MDESDVALHRPGGKSGRGPRPLDVEDHGRYLGVIAEAADLRHQRYAWARRGGHGPCARPLGAQDDPDGGQLVLGLAGADSPPPVAGSTRSRSAYSMKPSHSDD